MRRLCALLFVLATHWSLLRLRLCQTASILDSLTTCGSVLVDALGFLRRGLWGRGAGCHVRLRIVFRAAGRGGWSCDREGSYCNTV